jgi:hypothetical protein
VAKKANALVSRDMRSAYGLGMVSGIALSSTVLPPRILMQQTLYSVPTSSIFIPTPAIAGADMVPHSLAMRYDEHARHNRKVARI